MTFSSWWQGNPPVDRPDYELLTVQYRSSSNPEPGRGQAVYSDPDAYYIRRPIAPTYDRAWQGFQKQNPQSLNQYAYRHYGMGMHVPGTDPPASPYTANPMQNQAAYLQTIQKNAAHPGAVGPGMTWMPNPTSPGTTASAYAASTPSVWRSILNRLGF
jgi:hypothetical protein